MAMMWKSKDSKNENSMTP